MTRTIRIPIKRMFSNIDWEEYNSIHPLDFEGRMVASPKYGAAERDISEIKDLIKKIYDKLQDEFIAGNSPTHLMLNTIDYEFLKAYFKFVYEPVETYWKVDNYTNRALKEIFGLKIIVSSTNLFRLGWEP